MSENPENIKIEEIEANVKEEVLELLPTDKVLVKTEGFGNFATIDSLDEGQEPSQADDGFDDDFDEPVQQEGKEAAAAEAEISEDVQAENQPLIESKEKLEEKQDPMEDLGEEPEPYEEPVITDLYYDYTDRMEGIENNRYFRYMYEMVRAGENRFEQTNQVLHKIVDETWLKTIEDSLDALNRIVANPRKFIKTEEEIVPVGLAKKITAESVKHLSKNTQFIVSEPGEDVQPTKILNSTVEETYDLYENRFIYHLIQRLVRFIDKRTDVIFWSTGDEKRNKLVYETKVDDAYEQIEYKVEMTIRNLQSYAENDADHMETFARIDRLRRLVMSLKSCGFCKILAGCAKVRSPIQRTNLMIKDPDYRTCYKLWHFLEDYDDVGYRIEVEEDAMAFDDEYVSQMYTGMVNNYTVFKSLIEDDDRTISDELIRKKELQILKSESVPKFVKQIQDAYVENRDLPDVEIRQIFVDEVTQAQLDAEAKAEACEKAMLEAQQKQAEAEHEILIARHEMEEAVIAAKEANRRMEEAEEKARVSRERASQAENERKATEQRCREEVNKAQTDADLKVLKAEEDARKYKADADAEAAAYKEKADADAAEVKAKAEADAAEVKAKAEADAAEVKAKAEADAENYKKQADEEARAFKEKAETEANAVKEKAETEAKAVREKADADVKAVTEKADADVKAVTEKAAADLKSQVEAVRTEAEEKYNTLAEETGKTISTLEEDLNTEKQARTLAEDKAEKSKKAREAAENFLHMKEEEYAQLEVERDFALKNLEKLENKVAVAQRLKDSAENRAMQKVYSLQSTLQKAKQAEEDEKALRKEREQQLEQERNSRKELEKELAKQKAEYEKQIAELKESRSVLKWFKK